MSFLVWFEIIAACITYGLGFIGNILSLIIFFSQEEFRHVSTGVLFILMTLSNNIHLWTLITEFLAVFNIYVYSGVVLRCRLNYFIQNLSRTMSTYLAVTITLDRLIRSELPMRSRIICTRQNALKLTVVYLIIFSILYSFWFCPMITLNPITNTCYSGQSPIFSDFISNIYLPVRLIIVCIIPVIIMSLANIRMLFNIRQSRRRVDPRNQIDNTNIPAVSTSIITNGRMTPIDRMLFYMMLISVGTFVVTQIPFNIYSLIRANYETLDMYTHLLVRAILLIWSSIYFGIGFYLYCLASPLFREKFIRVTKKLITFICRLRPA
ncbi:unnamed protein product [Rotaria sordida]|uniref:G-protein coupled receptors family 1 profile domain-containing protein n=1 Tax=Rotaria sordida TaxID=392033 RepID=A0A815ANP2_9BILA|nr:unnamed protein product [Rotaria sordida]CAF1539413.1 unnamed protein product [Rotaria sordida]